MRHETALVWICACNDPDIEYGQCTPAKPFKSLKRKETAEHEREHSALIERRSNLMEMVVTIQSVIGPELRVGTWEDWRGVLWSTKAFAKFAHEQQSAYGRPLFFSVASDNLEQVVRHLIWCQTFEGQLVEKSRRMGAAYNALETLFGKIQRHGERNRPTKLSSNALLETTKVLLKKVEEAAEEITKKFPAAEGLSDLWSKIEFCQCQMENELQKSNTERP